jgi:DNA-binding transcriptional LysR family regulator
MPIRHATLHQLKIFDTLARHMSITRTAEALHLTPPAVSIQVKQLAEAAGEPLLEQVGKQLYLTDAGDMVAAACRDVLQRMELLGQELATMKSMEKGLLRVSIITTAKYFIPDLLGKFSRLHPGIEVSLYVGNRQGVLERLVNNEDDLYILGQPPEHLQVNATAFAPNPLVAIADPQHPLAGDANITAEQLENEAFILREQGSGIRLACERFFKERKVKLNTRMELGSNEAIKQTILARLGISFMAETTVHNELERGELVKLDVSGLPIVRQWYLAYPQQHRQTPAAKAFQTFLMAQFEQADKV